MKKGSEGALPGGQVGFEHVEMIRPGWREKQGLGREGLAQEGSNEVGKETNETRHPLCRGWDIYIHCHLLLLRIPMRLLSLCPLNRWKDRDL